MLRFRHRRRYREIAMKTKYLETRHKRTWFGAKANVTIGPGFLHRAGLGGFAIPHPPLANLLLRKGMSGDLQRRLSFTHEFAHFQTAPLVLAYMAALFSLIAIQGGIDLKGILILLTSTQALWEILSEGLVILEAPAAYRAWYDGIPRWPRFLFWGIGSLVATAGWLVVFNVAIFCE